MSVLGAFFQALEADAQAASLCQQIVEQIVRNEYLVSSKGYGELEAREMIGAKTREFSASEPLAIETRVDVAMSTMLRVAKRIGEWAVELPVKGES